MTVASTPHATKRNTTRPLDCIYVAASAHDARFTRICVASIRHFYPHVVLKLLAGGKLQPGLGEELARYWDVGAADVPAGDYGWGFVKLEPLFGKGGERFLVVDSDTVFAGPVLDVWAKSTADFLVDDEQQTEVDTHRLYYDWRKVAAIDSAARAPQFVFNTGQLFGSAGVLTRKDFAPWIDWIMPRRLKYPDCFMPGEQGILNFVLNQESVRQGVRVERRKIMLWPGHGMEGLDARMVAQREGPPVVVHWAGMKKRMLSDMAGSDLLLFFERLYYRCLPRPRLQRIIGVGRHALTELRTRMRIRARTLRGMAK
ncbi:MAG: hypothetical protein WBD53_08160 [Xanthobacteraceae bacterium]